MNTTIQFTLPSGNAYGFNMPADTFDKVLPFDWLNPEINVPDNVAIEDRDHWRHSLAAIALVTKFEQVYQEPPNESTKFANHPAVVEAVEYLRSEDGQPTADRELDEFAEEFRRHIDTMATMVVPAMTEHFPEALASGASPETLVSYDRESAAVTVDVVEYDHPARVYSIFMHWYINGNVHDMTNLLMRYSLLRQQGKTANEIAEALVMALEG